jgi:hypothetical protein
MTERKLRKLDKLLMELCDEYPRLTKDAQQFGEKIREEVGITGDPGRPRYGDHHEQEKITHSDLWG